MFANTVAIVTMLAAMCICVSQCCLITNCPRGGKRGHSFHQEASVKQCVSCGPARSGQCFGANICCGPFGCLIGTPETVRCQREGFFHEAEPCVAGTAYCRKNTGRCAGDGICCTQESCHVDKSCMMDEKVLRAQEVPLESLYNIFSFPNQADYANEMNAV